MKVADLQGIERWHGLTLDFAYPPNYPFDKVDVRPVDQQMRRKRHQSRRDGDLCYMQEELEGWALGYGIDRAILGAEQWFRGEITGHFEDEVPAAELIAYFEGWTDHVRSVLIPDHVLHDQPITLYGELNLEWDGEKHGLALANVDRKVNNVPERERQRVNTQLWRSVRGPQKVAEVPGLWLRLTSEPRPFSDLAGLEEALIQHGGISPRRFQQIVEERLSRSGRVLGWLPIGLTYPARVPSSTTAEHEWLFFCLEWPTLAKNLVKARRLRPSVWKHVVLRGIPSYSVRRSDLLRRQGPLYNAERLAASHVVVVGTGALGSPVARQLTASGVGQVTLVEHDVVKPGNVMRHEARMPDIGKLKSVAMEQILYETYPYVDVQTIPGTRTTNGLFEELMLNADQHPTLIIATVAVRAVDGQIDEVARRAAPAIPVLHAWVMAQAQVLRAFLYRDRETACFWCNGLYAKDRQDGIENDYLLEPSVEHQPFFETSCASPVFAGGGNAHALAAHIIVDMALDVLHERLPDRESHWVFAGNRIRDLDETFPVAPLTVARRGFTPHAACPVCNDTILSAELSEEQRASYDQAMGEIPHEA
ncbi:MAG: ThiF family adenylyltransferase [Chloroflexota bacterium]|nr:ThiF family adenylyltransferase [Chloroflexota bacterium]